MAGTNGFDVLSERGFVEQVTDEEGVKQLLEQKPQTIYCGFDPTADSLHIGSLVPVMGLLHLQRAGHRVLVLLGGATGMIGDPSGKSEERSFLDEASIEANLQGQAKQFAKILDFEGSRDAPAAELVNNLDWTRDVTVIDWLRGVGKKFTVNYMMAKESVRARLEDRDQGISYTEFSYMLLQAWDFAQLYEKRSCRMQVGGGDQWGNITAGIELVRRGGGEQAYGITFPLMTTASGQKFGKTEKGAVWIDRERTSIWDFYQYWIRTDDRDVVRYLKLFTLLELDEIAELEAQHEAEPGARIAHRRLAHEVTALIHGEAEATRMAEGAEALYAGQLEKLDADLIEQVFAGGPVTEIERAALEAGIDLVELAAECGVVASKGDARRMLKQGALYVNDQKVEQAERTITLEDLLPSQTVILRRGKKEYRVIRLKG